MSFKETVGKRLKLIRQYGDYKQKDLAAKLNIKPSLLSLYEQGKREPSLKFLKNFCDFFDISLSHFFNMDQVEKKYIDEDSENKIVRGLNEILEYLERLKIAKVKGRQSEIFSSNL